MKTIEQIEQALKQPFAAQDIIWRVQRAGEKFDKPYALVLAYVDARAIHDRLDAVVGILNWRDTYRHEGNGVMCRLELRINNGEWVWKENGSDETDIEAYKGGVSKALVRVASSWGIGRYLYNLSETYAKCVWQKTDIQPPSEYDRGGWQWGQINPPGGAKKSFLWKTPTLPTWALPQQEGQQ